MSLQPRLRRSLWGCLVALPVLGLPLACLALSAAAVAWFGWPGALSAADIEQLARADVHSRAAPHHETVAVLSVRLQRMVLGQTALFGATCDSVKHVVEYSRLYLQGQLSNNWCTPFQPVWEVRVETYWPDRPIPTMHIYMLYTTDGRLMYSYGAAIP